MKQLHLRILSTFIIIFILFSLVFGIFLNNLLDSHSRERQSDALIEQARLMGSFLTDEFEENEIASDTLAQIEAVSVQLDERVTVIQTDGTVIYDSEANEEELENHAHREEIEAVMNGSSYGIGSRVSSSTNIEEYYVAVPLFDETGDIVNILRLSQPVETITQLYNEINQSLVLFIIVAILVASVITYLTTKRIIRPIEEVMDVTRELSEKHYTVRYSGDGFGEISKLGATVNELAESLENQMLEIRQNDERLYELINHLVIGVMLLDNQRNIQMVNPAMNRILGEDTSKLLGKTYVEAIKSYGLSHIIERAYRRKKAQNNEIYFYYPHDKIVDANIVPINGKNPGELNVIVLLYDITEIRRLEKVRTDFVANASHELRTPVTALKGFAETLLDGAKEDKEVLDQFLEIMLKESIRLDSIVNDILELSRVEQKQVPVNAEDVIISEAVESTFKLVKQKAEIKQMELSIIEEEAVIIETDLSRLKQVLANLINNAIVYTQEQGKVVVKIRKEDEYAVIEVSDNGIGIPEDEQGRVFERFYRVDKARSRNSGGTGLGLSIVKYLVENLNGSITVKSKLGLGTTFTVKLPYHLI
ncbi:PAS domain S-box protein [Desemzia sp. RIT804]|uniref:two-component system histidine kinase PnpS n=1 Tax=Desemzia sp. RIT 804 TaxID=2810209 RepID=UPI00194DD72D|nr:ATP-binding protein [Desemzia sp. RIT 804]MBM6615664.1 PAS domain S-box protein [Desemzia sp. RIT 804]